MFQGFGHETVSKPWPAHLRAMRPYTSLHGCMNGIITTITAASFVLKSAGIPGHAYQVSMDQSLGLNVPWAARKTDDLHSGCVMCQKTFRSAIHASEFLDGCSTSDALPGITSFTPITLNCARLTPEGSRLTHQSYTSNGIVHI